jgi:hypothetical protein
MSAAVLAALISLTVVALIAASVLERRDPAEADRI